MEPKPPVEPPPTEAAEQPSVSHHSGEMPTNASDRNISAGGSAGYRRAG